MPDLDFGIAHFQMNLKLPRKKKKKKKMYIYMIWTLHLTDFFYNFIKLYIFLQNAKLICF